jgi:hypothetical protein
MPGKLGEAGNSIKDAAVVLQHRHPCCRVSGEGGSFSGLVFGRKRQLYVTDSQARYFTDTIIIDPDKSVISDWDANFTLLIHKATQGKQINYATFALAFGQVEDIRD